MARKVYRNPICKRVVDLFIPKEGTKEYRVLKENLKDAASKEKWNGYMLID